MICASVVVVEEQIRKVLHPIERVLKLGYIKCSGLLSLPMNVIQYNTWIKRTFTPTPLRIKQETVKYYASRFCIDTFVETGTYRGDMVAAVRDRFNHLYSIEIDRILAQNARQRFRRFQKVTVIEGDSGDVLPKLLKHIKANCLFWLDAHYSGGVTSRGKEETPILKEIECILNHRRRHIILVDDSRHFTTKNGYPTLDSVRDLVGYINRDYAFWIQNDILRIYPKQ